MTTQPENQRTTNRIGGYTPYVRVYEVGFSSYPHSENTAKILSYLNEKYGQVISPIGLLKVLSVISPFVNDRLPNLNIENVAPTRKFKSRTSIEAQTIIPKSRWLKLKDDDTLNAILERYRKGNIANLGTKAMFLDDGTTLLASKPKRTKDRLINGLAVFLSEGSWSYGERQNPDLTLKGNVSLIMNLTLESYNRYESGLLGSTFLERFLTIFHDLPEQELNVIMETTQEREKLTWDTPLKNVNFKPFTIENLEDYNKLLIDYAERFSVYALKSKLGSYDQILALVKSHLALNNRTVITEDDISLLKMVEPYLINPSASNRHRIIRFYKEGRSSKDICLLLNQKPDKYKPYVLRVIREAKERGVV